MLLAAAIPKGKDDLLQMTFDQRCIWMLSSIENGVLPSRNNDVNSSILFFSREASMFGFGKIPISVFSDFQ